MGDKKEVRKETNATILHVEPRIYALKPCIDYLVPLTFPSSFLFLTVPPFLSLSVSRHTYSPIFHSPPFLSMWTLFGQNLLSIETQVIDLIN